MDIEAISGPGTNERIYPVATREAAESAPATQSILSFRLNVRDRVTISPEARRRYNDSQAKNRKRNGPGRGD
ncbi:MAG: hypothetical protein C4560_14695 [Nitrospiraceae bacterium]|nr:MAG: hypothetical protein C4560_14695 [Nitrospiraceae bacterium]